MKKELSLCLSFFLTIVSLFPFWKQTNLRNKCRSKDLDKEKEDRALKKQAKNDGRYAYTHPKHLGRVIRKKNGYVKLCGQF